MHGNRPPGAASRRRGGWPAGCARWAAEVQESDRHRPRSCPSGSANQTAGHGHRVEFWSGTGHRQAGPATGQCERGGAVPDQALRLEDIAALIGSARATLYYHFSGCDDLVAFLLEEHLRAAGEAIELAVTTARPPTVVPLAQR